MQSPIDIRDERGVRYLHFGTEWVQGAMRLRAPQALELAYTREMMAGLLIHDAPWPRRVLSIGLGAGSLVKFIHAKLPDATHTVVEIEPRVVSIAQSYFHVPEEDERLMIEIDDGLDFVACSTACWDLILLDAYDHEVRPGPLSTAAFYRSLRDHLSAQGLMSVNLFNRNRRYDTLIARIDAAFESRSLAFASADKGNYVAFGAAGERVSMSAETLRERAAELQQRTGLDLRPTVSRLIDASNSAGDMLEI